jgi:nucleotide-binding universal stress UspA family protein
MRLSPPCHQAHIRRHVRHPRHQVMAARGSGAAKVVPFLAAIDNYGARLVVVHVTPTSIVAVPLVTIPTEPVDVRERLLEELASLRSPDPKVWLERHLKEGDPATEILQFAQQIRCDLIVMGTHGRTGLRRLIVGSVAEQVLRKAPCAVLTVKTPVAVASSETGSRRQEANA